MEGPYDHMKRLQMVWFELHDILEKVKLWRK